MTVRQLFALTPLLLGACMIFVGPSDKEVDLRDLVSARARWNANGVSDYDLIAVRQCFCVGAGVRTKVQVRANLVTAVSSIDTGQPLDSSLASLYRPVDRLFDLIEDAVRQHAYRIDATYDQRFGFPSHFFVDPNQNAADEEFGYSIESFTPITR